MNKIYIVKVYEPSNVVIVENQSVGGYICTVHFQYLPYFEYLCSEIIIFRFEHSSIQDHGVGLWRV